MLVLPYARAAAVTPSDSTVLAKTRAIYVGGAGALVVQMADTAGTTAFAAVPAGTTLAIRVTKVLSSGTGATSIVALW